MRLIDEDAFDSMLKDAQAECKKSGGNFRYGVLSTVRANLANMPTIDAVQIVRCKECKHKPTWDHNSIEFPDDKCPCQCEDCFYSWIPKDDWYCANGERRKDDV